MPEYQNIKTFFQKTMFQIKILKILKILFPGHIFLVILMEKKLLERFTKENCKKQIKKTLNLKI